MLDYQYGRFIASLYAALARNPRSVYLRRLLSAAQARARAVMEAI